MCKVARQVLPEKAVGKEGEADQRQRQPEDAPCGVEEHQHQDAADHDVGVGRVAGALDQVGFEYPLVAGEHEGGDGERPFPAGDAAMASPFPGCRVEQEGQQQQETDVQRAHHQ